MVNIDNFTNKDRNDLTTPEHDALVLMLLDKEYVKSKVVDATRSKSISIDDIISEYPLVGYNGFNVGFVDIVVRTRWDCFDPKEHRIEIECPHCKCFPMGGLMDDALKSIDNNKVYTCISCKKEYVISMDLIRVPERTNQTDYYIECKPKIFSFGDTLRQLNKYREFIRRKQDGCSDRVFILFTPDTTFKKQFESQGYVVITP